MGGIKTSGDHVPPACEPLIDSVVATEFVAGRYVHHIGRDTPYLVERGFEMRLGKMSERARDDALVDRKGQKVSGRSLESQTAHIDVFSHVLPHQTFHIQFPLQNAAVVDRRAAELIVSEPVWDPQVAGDHGQTLFEKELGLDRLQEKRAVSCQGSATSTVSTAQCLLFALLFSCFRGLL